MINAMVSVDAVEVVDSRKFTDVFMKMCHQFDEDERTYYVVVSTDELSYIHISILLIYFLFFQTSNFRGRAQIHHVSERMPAK